MSLESVSCDADRLSTSECVGQGGPTDLRSLIPCTIQNFLLMLNVFHSSATLQLAGRGRGEILTAKIQPRWDERRASGRGTGKLEVAVVTRRGGVVLSTFCFWSGSDWPVQCVQTSVRPSLIVRRSLMRITSSFVVCCRSCGVYERNSL